MEKKEFLERYENEVPNGGKYGDRETSESIEKMYDQVQDRIGSGVKDWNGCINKALCCKFFEHTFDLSKLTDEFSKAHFGENPEPHMVELKVKKRCAQLQDDDGCGIYEERPSMCKEYLCQASKIRRNMFLRIMNPEIADAVDKKKNK
jgi:Fe-S-cluster containining protein